MTKRRPPRLAFVAAVTAFFMAFASVALADQIVNTIDTTIDGTPEEVTITAGGSTSVSFYVKTENNVPVGDENGCNATGAAPATVNFSIPANVTASASSLVLAGCGPENAQSITFGSNVVNTSGYPIGVSSVTGGRAGSLWETSPAAFKLIVNAATPSDTQAPQNATISIDDGAAWTNSATGSVSLDLSATDNVGVTRYRLAESQAGLATASDVTVSPAESNFSRTDVAFTLTGAEASSKAVWLRVCDAANLCSEASDTIGWDKTAPAITDTGFVSGTAGTNGWYTSAVTNGFSASDGLSGLLDCAATFSKSSGAAEGSAVRINSGSCSDNAGNTNSGIDSGEYKIDLTDPTMVCDAAPSFLLNQSPANVTATVSDGGSGPVNPANAAANTSTVGSKTVSVTGYDIAGRSASVNCSYSVGYQFVGFDRPVDNNSVLNKAKAGQAIPLKWRLLDVNNNPVTNLTSATVTVASLSCNLGTTLDALEEYAAGSSGLQNLGDGYYQFNWKTPTSYANSCKTMKLDLGEGSTRNALFQFTK